MKDIFGENVENDDVHVNIYADEIQSKVCSESGEHWHYIGLVVEDLAHPLLKDIIHARFKGNFDKNSPYYSKNNELVHWVDIRGADQKYICKRWFEYILNPQRNQRSFYSHILGLNNSKLSREEFDLEDEFNSKYNRFFRSAILYAIKTFFPGRSVIVENIFHEVGQQENNEFFPWHCIYKIQSNESNIIFHCDRIIFLPKDHTQCEESNLIQLCDCILGVSTNLIHGIEKSKSSECKEELMSLYSPLLERIINCPQNKNSSYQYYKRITISFFPKDKTKLSDYRRAMPQFYTNREIRYITQKSNQTTLKFNNT